MRKASYPALLVSLMALPLLAQADIEGVKSGEQMAREASAQVTSIHTDELKNHLLSEPELVLVDIRTPGEIRGMGGAIASPKNVNIPRGWLEYRIGQYTLGKDTPIVVYCGADYRSPLAADTLQRMGYTNVSSYADGYLGWRKAGLPTELPAE